MLKKAYLKYAVSVEAHFYREWLFCMLAPSRTRDNEFRYPGQMVINELTASFYDDEQKLVPIDDFVKGQALFDYAEPITVDATWLKCIRSELQTFVGTFIMNAFCIDPAFKGKFPYVAGPSSVKMICTKIAAVMKSTPKTEEERTSTDVYVDEYLAFIEALQIFESLAKALVTTATPKNTIAPPGITEYRNKLAKEYGDSLTDPVKFAEFEGKLKAYAKENMKGDPSAGIFFSGKAENVAYKKLYLTIGDEQKFTETVKYDPILTSLTEGMPTDVNSVVNVVNGARVGSFYRGAETVKGGVALKILIRAIGDFTLVDGDCGDTVGMLEYITAKNIDRFVGRYFLEQGKLKQIKTKQDLENYVGKVVIMRDAQTCKTQGLHVCRVCIGDNLMQYREKLVIPLTEESNTILNGSLKKMHGTVLTIKILNLNEILF